MFAAKNLKYRYEQGLEREKTVAGAGTRFRILGMRNGRGFGGKGEKKRDLKGRLGKKTRGERQLAKEIWRSHRERKIKEKGEKERQLRFAHP